MKKAVSLFLAFLMALSLSVNVSSEALSDVVETTTAVSEETTEAEILQTTEPATQEETTSGTAVQDEKTTEPTTELTTESTTEPTTEQTTEPITEQTTEPTTQEETTTENVTQPEEDSGKSDEDIVARLYLCSRWKNIFTTGHIWIYVLNLSDESFMVGTYPLSPGEGVSVATFGTTRYDGKGVYYNMEAYRNDKYCDSSCISISQEITRKELEKVSDKIINSNKWNFIVNCVYFACGVWNSVADKRVVPFFYPPVARAQIKAKGDGEICIMAHQPGEKSFKQRGSGDDAYMEKVCQKSLDA